MLSLRVSFTVLQSLRPSRLLNVREIDWRALYRQFLRLQRPSLWSQHAIPTSVQASGTPTSASTSPELLASVIQAIQTTVVICRGQCSFSFSRPSCHCHPRFFPCNSSSSLGCMWLSSTLVSIGPQLGFFHRLLHPVLLHYQWLRQRTC